MKCTKACSLKAKENGHHNQYVCLVIELCCVLGHGYTDAQHRLFVVYLDEAQYFGVCVWASGKKLEAQLSFIHLEVGPESSIRVVLKFGPILESSRKIEEREAAEQLC